MKDITKEEAQELRELARLAFRNSVGATEDTAVSFNYRDYSTLDLNFLWHFRALVLEEAAKVCDTRTAEPGWCCADAIREMQ